MEQTNDVNQGSSPEEVVVPNSEVVKTPDAPAPKAGEKVVPYERFKEVNDELAALKARKETQTQSAPKADALEFIKLGKKLQDYNDTEIDFATQFAKSNDPEEILKAFENKMVQQAIKAERESVEKERLALAPNSTQSESDRPKSLTQRLASATMAEKEQILAEQGLYKSPSRRPDHVNIGTQR